MILKIIIGLTTGFIFGFILQKTGITKYPRIIGMLLLKDFKVFKFMLSAVLFSMIGFYIIGDLGIVELYPKPLDLGKIFGGLIFGLGMGILGYCPGTLAARAGEGKKEVWFAALGLVLGILFFANNISFFKTQFLKPIFQGDFANLFGISQWIAVIIFAVIFVVILYLIDKNFDDNRKIF